MITKCLVDNEYAKIIERQPDWKLSITSLLYITEINENTISTVDWKIDYVVRSDDSLSDAVQWSAVFNSYFLDR